MDSEKVEAALAEASKVAEALQKPDNGAADPDGEQDAQAKKLKADDGDAASATADAASPDNGDDDREKVDFKVIYNKQKYDVTFPLDGNVGELKVHLQTLIGIPPAMMKVMIKGLAKDDRTLRSLNVTRSSKVMVVGSSLESVLAVSTAPSAKELREEGSGSSAGKKAETSSSREKMHKKVLDKGKPDDAMPGLKGAKEPLPTAPLSGMLNKSGGKVRLTFKLDQDQVWIGTKERTEKVAMSSIKTVVSEPIEGHEDYHIMAIQLGPTEASRYWVYWVPAQYVESIKDAILGKWQFY